MKKILTILFIILLSFSLIGCSPKKTEKSVEYYCNEGVLHGNNCEVSLTEKAIQTCDEGFSIKDGQCIKEEDTDAVKAKICPKDYKYKDNLCLSTTTYDKVESLKCELPSGIPTGEIKVFENGSIVTSTNEAYTRDNLCYMRIWKDYNEALDAYYNLEESTIDFTTLTVCPTDTEEIDGKCYKTTTPKEGYTCEQGELKKDKCHITTIKEIKNVCQSEGFVYNSSNKQCERINLTMALEK